MMLFWLSFYNSSLSLTPFTEMWLDCNSFRSLSWNYQQQQQQRQQYHQKKMIRKLLEWNFNLIYDDSLMELLSILMKLIPRKEFGNGIR